MSSRIPLAAVCAALLMTLAVTTAAADARPKKVPQTEFRDFTLKSASAVHEIEWHWLDSAEKDDCTGWEESSGVQTVKVDLAKPAPHQLMISGPHVGLMPTELVKFDGTISRRFDEQIEPPCPACGGELGECTGEKPKPPERDPYDCATRKLIVPQMPIVLFRRGMEKPPEDDDDLLAPASPSYIEVDLVSSADEYENCPPTHEHGPGLPSGLDSVGIQFGEGRLEQLLKTKPGGTVRLQGQRENGYTGGLNERVDSFAFDPDCAPLTGPGVQVCEKLKVDLVLERVAAEPPKKKRRKRG